MANTIGNLPVGSYILIPFKEGPDAFGKYETIVHRFMVVDKDHLGYPADSVTLTVVGMDAASGKYGTGAFGIFNRFQFNRTGSGYESDNVTKSAIFQWMNSDQPKGKWFTPQYEEQYAPDAVNQTDGLIALLDDRIKKYVLQTTLKIKRASGSLATTYQGKFFLPNIVELGYQRDDEQGAPWKEAPHYASFSASPYLSVTEYGLVYSCQYSSFDVADRHMVQCSFNVSKKMPISETTDSRGNYLLYDPFTVVINNGENEIGDVISPFTVSYSVRQNEGRNVNEKWGIDGNDIGTFSPAKVNVERTFTIPKDVFDGLSVGSHTLTYSLEREGEAISTTEVTFVKRVVKQMYITQKEPLASSKQPKRCSISVTRNIAPGATFRCEVTNNPYDELPVWEDCTEAVNKNLVYVFRNGTNASQKHGLNVRVTVDKGSATEPCWISAIGGAFDDGGK